MSAYETILVPFDFSEHSDAALLLARDLALRLGARVHLLNVIRPFVVAYPAWSGPAEGGGLQELFAMQRGAEEALRKRAETILPSEVPVETHVVVGPSVAGAIHELAEKLGADLIVMGTHGRTGFAHVFLGSNAERTLRGAPCPVLTVRAPVARDVGSSGSPPCEEPRSGDGTSESLHDAPSPEVRP